MTGPADKRPMQISRLRNNAASYTAVLDVVPYQLVWIQLARVYGGKKNNFNPDGALRAFCAEVDTGSA